MTSAAAWVPQHPPRAIAILDPIRIASCMSKPRESDRPTRAGGLIASALRTLEAEAGGIATLCAAIRDGLGRPFVDAVELIAGAQGRLIVSGMGKSGHVARKVAATFASTGTPAFFAHPSEASHGDLGMITPADVIMALSWARETVELKALIDYSRPRPQKPTPSLQSPFNLVCPL